MLLALTCALCTVPTSSAAPGPAPALVLVEPHLSVQETQTPAAPPTRLASGEGLATTPPARVPLSHGPTPDPGPGAGDHGDHSGHISPMWIVMGAMMVVMMIGVGAQVMHHGSAVARPLQPAPLTSPALLAVPVVSRTWG